MLGMYCFFETHGPYDFARSCCTPDANFKVVQKERHEMRGDLRNTSVCWYDCLHSHVNNAVLGDCYEWDESTGSPRDVNDNTRRSTYKPAGSFLALG